MPANRVVAIAASVIALLLAALPVVANMDWTSTAGIIAGIVAVLGIVQTWLKGWQQHEERTARNAGQPDALVNVQTSSGNASASFGNAAGVFSGAQPAVEGDEDPPPLNAKPDGEVLA